MDKNIRLNIIGMGCKNCVNKIKNALSTLSGVKNVEISLKEEAEVVYDSKIVEVDQLIDTIKSSGYDAKIK